MSRGAIPALLLILALAPDVSARQGGKPQEPAEAPVDTSREQQTLDELKEQAREDLEVWEVRVKARKSWVQEASRRVEIARAWRNQVEKQIKLGYQSSASLAQAELELDEYTARRDQKAVELKEAEVKFARAQRRLAALAKAGKYDVLNGAVAPAATELLERVADLETVVDRLRAELDEVRQKPRNMQAVRDKPKL